MNNKNKKSQAAMEFLMTYGWAILVVVASIAALAYFGVLSPDKNMPEKCILIPGLACLDHQITPATATIIVQNSLGFDLTVHSISIGNCTSSAEVEFENGKSNTFTLTGCGYGKVGEKFNEDVLINYTKDQGLTKTAAGNIITRIQ